MPDISTNKYTIGTFTDDTMVIATHDDLEMASLKLQDHLLEIEIWLQKWKLKLNEDKSQFRIICAPVMELR